MARRGVLGVLSMMFWSLILIVTVKYVLLIMRADNRGEGGILALMALAQRTCGQPADAPGARDGRRSPAPACSSATASSRRRFRCCPRSKGLRSSSPRLQGIRDPDLSVVVIVVLFAMQWRGTAAVGTGVRPGDGGVVPGHRPARAGQMVRNPAVLLAMSPCYAIAVMPARHWDGVFHPRRGGAGVTGAEALYADMGHFGRPPIRLVWIYLRAARAGAQLFRPGCAGAGRQRHGPENPFYLLSPEWLRLPLVVLATAPP